MVRVRKNDSNLLRPFIDDINYKNVIGDDFVGIDADSVDGGKASKRRLNHMSFAAW